MGDPFQIPSHIEQDKIGDDQLPTYNDLAEQNGPNSRFGRWREWIEKRAAERYNDLTPQEISRRRGRGWGDDSEPEPLSPPPPPFPAPTITVNEFPQTPPPTPPPKSLRVQTDMRLDSLDSTHTDSTNDPPTSPPFPLIAQALSPSHLRLNQFGSRFLPHTTSPIRCLLPLLTDRLLLIGHEEGLSVLNMFPQEWTDNGQIVFKGPDEAQAKLIWHGEGVYQMSILEEEFTGEGSPQGVILALVGPDLCSPSSKEPEAYRSIRMYNLASITSLAKWVVTQNGAPLDLRHGTNWAPQTLIKKHRKQNSITRSLKSLIESPTSPPSCGPTELTTSYPNMLSPSSAKVGYGGPSPRVSPTRQDTNDTWDMIDDLPLRWATDYVPLASAGSRLVNMSVLFYDLWREDTKKSRCGATLAVATKSNIFLYETPKGERAFRFVKEFYTPLPPRRITFIQQSVQDVSRSLSQASPPSHRSTHSRDRAFANHNPPNVLHRNSSSISFQTVKVNPDVPLSYGTQRSLFVIFEKKAGWIRLADSAVGEIELYEDGLYSGSSPPSSSLSGSNIRLSRAAFESNPNKGHWVPPVRIDLPALRNHQHDHSISCSLYFLTRGKQTHILPCPLPTNFSSVPPIYILSWESTPTTITSRLCFSTPTGEAGDRRMSIQLIAFGEDGVEIQEISLAFLTSLIFPTKGKGKARGDDLVRAQDDLGGTTGFLCVGGRWDRFDHLHGPSSLSRVSSVVSATSGTSTETLASEDTNSGKRFGLGVYGWCQKGAQDFRVFWLGSPTKESD